MQELKKAIVDSDVEQIMKRNVYRMTGSKAILWTPIEFYEFDKSKPMYAYTDFKKIAIFNNTGVNKTLLLLHEVLHITLRHDVRRDKLIRPESLEDAVIFNYASDEAINQFVRKQIYSANNATVDHPNEELMSLVPLSDWQDYLKTGVDLNRDMKLDVEGLPTEVIYMMLKEKSKDGKTQFKIESIEKEKGNCDNKGKEGDNDGEGQSGEGKGKDGKEGQEGQGGSCKEGKDGEGKGGSGSGKEGKDGEGKGGSGSGKGGKEDKDRKDGEGGSNKDGKDGEGKDGKNGKKESYKLVTIIENGKEVYKSIINEEDLKPKDKDKGDNLRKDIRNDIRITINEDHKGNAQQGFGLGNMQQELEFEKINLDLKTALQNTFNAEKAGSININFKKNNKMQYTMNRAHPDRFVKLPAYTSPVIENLDILVDTSGSVPDEEYSRFISIIKDNKKYIKSCNVYMTDGGIQNVIKMNSFNETEFLNAIKKRQGYGGTDYTETFKQFEKNEGKLKIVFTDFLVDIPPKPKGGKEVIWIANLNSKSYINSKSIPYGKVVWYRKEERNRDMPQDQELTHNR